MPGPSGWKKIWIVEYRADTGEWFPADKQFYAMRQLANEAFQREKREFPSGRYRIKVYCPKES